MGRAGSRWGRQWRGWGWGAPRSLQSARQRKTGCGAGAAVARRCGPGAGHQVALLSAAPGRRWPGAQSAERGARPQPGAREGPSVGSAQDSASSTTFKWWKKSHSKLCFPREPIFLAFFSCTRFYGARTLLSRRCVREPRAGLRGIKRSAERGARGGLKKPFGVESGPCCGVCPRAVNARVRSEPGLCFPRGRKGLPHGSCVQRKHCVCVYACVPVVCTRVCGAV